MHRKNKKDSATSLALTFQPLYIKLGPNYVDIRVSI